MIAQTPQVRGEIKHHRVASFEVHGHAIGRASMDKPPKFSVNANKQGPPSNLANAPNKNIPPVNRRFS